jgi:hypothetical protein
MSGAKEVTATERFYGELDIYYDELKRQETIYAALRRRSASSRCNLEIVAFCL